MNLKESVGVLKGVGKKRLKQYEKLNIFSLKDLLFYFPKRYLDCSRPKSLKEVEVGLNCCIKARVLEKFRPLKKTKSLTIFKASAEDFLGLEFELIFFNNIYSFNSIKLGESYIFFGKFEYKFSLKQLVVLKVFSLNSAGLIPIYGLTAGLSSKIISLDVRKIFSFENFIMESLPDYIVKKNGLVGLKEALKAIHFPSSMVSLKKARKRLVFEELLIWQLNMLFLKNCNKVFTCKVLKDTNYSEFLKNLPFKLTNSQKLVLDECILDCIKPEPMNRLIQGDVGCGKTVVAAILAYLFCKNKMQVGLMAPTEVLAKQHYTSFLCFFKPFNINVELLVGSNSLKQKGLILEKLKRGEIDVLIGTHALFQDRVIFFNLGLTITDEQHRFGVLQRKKLESKGNKPNRLVMSATPIPRTLALMVYGDLDISTIKELPRGRLKIQTIAINSSKRKRALSFVEKQINFGRQAYVVCPLIEDGEKDAESVLKYVENLKKVLKNVSVVGLHGKMAPKDKEDIMDRFLKKEIDILVSTTVIEVGINVKNANIIIIENAELFGLSQLHQLRGRVGRGSFKSYCILISNFKTKETSQRLKIMCDTSDGFEISRKDLILRGPGDFFSQKQHGFLKFKLFRLDEDFEMFKLVKLKAKEILRLDEKLVKEENAKLKKALDKQILNNELTI